MDRALFFYERMLFLGGRAPWNVSLHVRLRGPLAPDALAAALALLQARHPELRAGIEIRAGRPWFTAAASPPPIPIGTVRRTADTDWLTLMRDELVRPFALPSGPLARLTRILPAADDPDPDAGTGLMLTCHHCICTGGAVVQLMQELLAVLAAPARLPPLAPILSLADLSTAIAPALAAIGRRQRAGLLAARLLLPVVRPVLSRRRRRSPAYLLHWELDDPTRAALALRCRAEDVTTYQALAVALLQAWRSVRRGRSPARMVCPVDIRARLPGLDPGRLFPLAEALTLSLDGTAGDGFWTRARAIRARLGTARAALDPPRRLAMAEQLHPVCDALIDLVLRGRIRQDLSFTYFGAMQLPSGDGPLALQGPATICATAPGREGTLISAVQDQGRLAFMLTSYEELLPQADALRIRDEVAALLTQAVAA